MRSYLQYRQAVNTTVIDMCDQILDRVLIKKLARDKRAAVRQQMRKEQIR